MKNGIYLRPSFYIYLTTPLKKKMSSSIVLPNIIILPWARRPGGVPDIVPSTDHRNHENWPDFFLLNSPRTTLEGIFRNKIKNDRELIIISAKEKTPIWRGFTTIDDDNTLFLRGNDFEHVSSLEYDSLKESLVAVIELAEESLKCDTIVICLDRNDKNSCHLSTLIRCFFYLGFELVPPKTYNHSNEFILVGMEL
ncbi:ornithine decarboxylase antizyme 1 [Rhizophagus clarus]|uniref:Ornithine decarboxylase antizyme n=1 Tax=Rhizophagus clarus TaxID=94130 RepID=A0A8H3R380_9GLOM|nr:ornithine decarboxylase antizyme 1 [Rhizophagus clarus]